MVRAMRVVDLDRDMSDVIPTGLSRDSEFLFDRMTSETLDAALPGPGRRVLDVASGVGQDTIAMAMRNAKVVGAEPSQRMIGMARMFAEDKKIEMPSWVQCWSDRLPFETGAFDACICKGAMDHFDRPEEAIAEMARVTRPEGRVVLAIANFESLSCRTARSLNAFQEGWLARSPRRGRRPYDVPSDHFTRYELDLMREQASRHLELEVVEGISLGWCAPGWSKAMSRLPRPVAFLALQAVDWVARAAPSLADVIVLAGRPRRSSNTSA